MAKRVFLEAGALYPNLTYLLRYNWREINADKIKNEDWHGIPKTFDYGEDDIWFGVFVEPHPANLFYCWEALKAEVVKGWIKPDSYLVYQAALSAAEDWFVPFYTELSFGLVDWVGHTEGSFRNNLLNEYPIQCATFALDDMFQVLDEDGNMPDLVKLDIEGAEIDLLECYSFSHKPSVWNVECHDHHENAVERVKEIFLRNGYEIEDLMFNADTPGPEIVATLK